jgi:1-acyl-sn-glycerol-3-phosphate acyltransferase
VNLPLLSSAWFRLLPHLVTGLFFGRIRLRGEGLVPASGPVLLIGRHRNGVADGYVYAAGLPRQPTFMIAARLRRRPLVRLLVTGIDVVRDKDAGDRSINQHAITTCVERLAAGDAVFIFPEGTSTLGARHLPFKTGAARVASEFLALYGALTVVPLAIDYDAPAVLGGNAEITIGAPLRLRGTLDVDAIHERFAAALETTGREFRDDAQQRTAEALASLAADAGHSYAAALDGLARELPQELRERLATLDYTAGALGVLSFQGRPVFARRRAFPRALIGAAGLLVAAPGILANFPPLAAASFAARRKAGGGNEVMAWRILAGLPLAIAWAGIVIAGALAALPPVIAATYLALTALAARLHAPARRAFAAGMNALLRPRLAPLYAGAQDAVLRHLGR